MFCSPTVRRHRHDHGVRSEGALDCEPKGSPEVPGRGRFHPCNRGSGTDWENSSIGSPATRQFADRLNVTAGSTSPSLVRPPMACPVMEDWAAMTCGAAV